MARSKRGNKLMSQKYLFNGGTGDFERLPGTENDKLTLGEQMLLKPEF